jgi:D-serine deaminase-like pyridoxal phosphate-dependent protein
VSDATVELGPFGDATACQLDPRAFAAVLEAMGQAGSIHLLPTPALLCEVPVLDRNIALMQQRVSEHELAIRPHSKSHKTAFIADRQIRAGANGIACAKIGEAEAICDAYDSIDVAPPPILLTSPVVGTASVVRVAALAARTLLTLALDDPSVVSALSTALDEDVTLDVVIDVDTGMGRTGVTTVRDAELLVQEIFNHENTLLAGLQAYAGHVQHVAGRKARADANEGALKLARDIIGALTNKGALIELRTGGGTGTHAIDPQTRVLNELQPGSYVFMDREYRDAIGGDETFEQSLFVLSTVISANHTSHATVDAGLKALATDAGDPVLQDGRSYGFFGDEHGVVTTIEGPLTRGERVRIVPAHCDPTVNLYDHLWLVDGDTVLGVAPIVARGRGY